MLRLSLVAGTLLLASCGGGEPAAVGAAIQACIPGSTAACVCASGASGSQSCAATGAFAPCECSAGGDADVAESADVAAPPACIPGASVACTCTSGASGAQVCQAGGLYAPCECAAVEVPDAGTTDPGGSPPDAGGPPDPGSPTDSAIPADPGGPPACIAGQSVACACTTGGSGAQVCLEDGTFGACVCETVDAGPVADPGEPADASPTPDSGATLPPLGAQVPIAMTQKGEGVVDLAVDETHVYWVTTLGNIQVVGKTGGFAATLKDGQLSAGALLADADNLYWSILGGQGGSTGTLRSIAKDGDGLSYVEIASQLSYPLGLAQDADYLYVSEWSVTTAKIKRFPKKGGPPSDLTAFGAMSLASDGDDLYALSVWSLQRIAKATGQVTDLPLSGNVLAIDASDAYALVGYAGQPAVLARVSKSGGLPEPLYSFASNQSDVAADASRVYVTGILGNAGVLWGFDKTGAPPGIIAFLNNNVFGALAVDDSGVYVAHWATASGILAIPKL